MKEMTWGEYKEKRWGDIIDKDPAFDLERKAYYQMTGRTLADTAYSMDPDSFCFDEWIMPDDWEELSDEEIIEGLKEYMYDYIGHEHFVLNEETGIYTLDL